MANKIYGFPVVTLRLPQPMINAVRICARRHDTTFSGLIRDLIEEQLRQDGIVWQAVEPTPGQKSLDDYLMDANA